MGNDSNTHQNHGVRRKWENIFNMLNEKNYQSRILVPEKISFKDYGDTKIFSDEGKLSEFVDSRPKVVAKGSSSDRKRMIRERNFIHQE